MRTSLVSFFALQRVTQPRVNSVLPGSPAQHLDGKTVWGGTRSRDHHSLFLGGFLGAPGPRRSASRQHNTAAGAVWATDLLEVSQLAKIGRVGNLLCKPRSSNAGSDSTVITGRHLHGRTRSRISRPLVGTGRSGGLVKKVAWLHVCLLIRYWSVSSVATPMTHP